MESQGLWYQPRAFWSSPLTAISSDKRFYPGIWKAMVANGPTWLWKSMLFNQHARHIHRCNCSVTIMGATSSFQIKFKAHSTGGTVFGTVGPGKNHARAMIGPSREGWSVMKFCHVSWCSFCALEVRSLGLPTWDPHIWRGGEETGYCCLYVSRLCFHNSLLTTLL